MHNLKLTLNSWIRRKNVRGEGEHNPTTELIKFQPLLMLGRSPSGSVYKTNYSYFVVQIELMENWIQNASKVVRVLLQHAVRFQTTSFINSYVANT